MPLSQDLQSLHLSQLFLVANPKSTGTYPVPHSPIRSCSSCPYNTESTTRSHSARALIIWFINQLISHFLQVPDGIICRLGKNFLLCGEVILHEYMYFLCTEIAAERFIQHVTTHNVLEVVDDILPPLVTYESRPPLEDRKILVVLQVEIMQILLCSFLVADGGNNLLLIRWQ